MAHEESKTQFESFPMNGGDGPNSYANNSYYQKAAGDGTKTMIDEAIAKNLDIKHISSSNTFRLTDLGCSVGPNTFFVVQNIVEAVKLKFQFKDLPEFHVFFNDHASNDFNTLFVSLPIERQYFAVGVPGSFHGRLFPRASLNFVHSAYALQWLTKVPREVVDKNSSAWNKGKIHYETASKEVQEAYSAQFYEDVECFMKARAEELMEGGLMALILPALSNEAPHSQSSVGLLYDVLGSSLMDMAKTGLVSEAKIDSFNLPLYIPTPKEMEALIEKNGCFSIDRIELLTPYSARGVAQPNPHTVTMHIRAGMEGLIKEHFGTEIIDELFERVSNKLEQSSYILDSGFLKSNQLFILLKRRV